MPQTGVGMIGLSQELARRCHEVFSRCDEFSNQDALRAVFVTEGLSLYRDRLPEAGNTAERINLTVDYLRIQHLSNGRPAFPIFLAALRDRRHPDDALYNELQSLHAEVQQKLGQIEAIDVPLVIAAMNQEEAASLKTGQAFAGLEVAPIDRVRFEQLENVLVGVDWNSHYKTNRDEWNPHTAPGSTIDGIVVDILSHINRCEREPKNLPIVRRQSFSEDFFKLSKQVETWDRLRQSGGVMIVDAVSLFHPGLRDVLVQSALTAHDNVAVLVLSPSNAHELPANQLVETVLSARMQVAFSRFAERLDSHCEMGIGDLRTLQRWLFAHLPWTAEVVQKQVVIANRRFVRDQAPEKPRGIGQAIFMDDEA